MKDSSRVLVLALLLLGYAVPSFCQLQPAKTFVYVHNIPNNSIGPSSVSAFSVGSDGALTPVVGSPFLTGGSGSPGFLGPSRIAVTTSPGNFLYAANNASNNISGFSIDTTTGVLTPVPGSPFAMGAGNSSGISLAVTPDGQFLYAGNSAFPASSSISAFSIASNGALTPIQASPFPADLPINMKVSPDRRFLAVAQDGFGLAMFSVGSNGALTRVPGSPFPVSGFPEGLDVNCASNLLFAPTFISGQGGVNVLNIASNGVLTQIAGSPFTFSENLSFLDVLSPDDLHLFIGNLRPGNTITSLSVASGVHLTEVSGSPFPTGPEPVTMATNQAGTLLYVARLGFGDIVGFNIDSNGALSPVPGSPFSTVPSSLLSVAVFPPKTCFGNLAARQAQTDAGGQYGLGGKGFDFSSPSVDGSNYSGNQCEFQLPNSANPSTAPCYIKPAEINNRYKYADSNVPHNGELFFDFGMDCSGLVLWSYNTAVNATNVAQAPGSPAQGTDAKLLPIWWEGVGAPWQTPPTDGQCTDAQSIFLINNLGDPAQAASYTAPLDLRPGDLLCFKYHQSDGSTNPHVALYLGNQSTQTGVGGSSLDSVEDYTRTYGVKFDHVDSRGSSNLSRVFQDVSLTKNCLIQSTAPCFDFLGYRRPRPPRAAILFQAHSPVSLVVTDPDGSTITASSWFVTEHEASRSAGGLSYNDYSPSGDDMVFSPTLKPGTYTAQVVAKIGAAPTDTYSLTVTAGGSTITLADNVPISEIPRQGYAVTSNGTTITVPQGDTIPPTTTAALLPQPNAAGWNNTNVTVTLNSTDNEPGGSGVKQITYSATGAQALASATVNASSVPILISAEGTTTISFFGTDNEGNVENPKHVVVMLDKTPPSVNCGSSDGPWHATDVSIPCTANDSGSGLANSPDGSFTLSTNVPAGSETSNAATASRSVCDIAGNCMAAGPITGNMVDKKPPSINVSSPTSGGSYLLNQAVNANYGCADGGSGVATCTGTVASGSAIDTSSVGSKTFIVNATDRVGNIASPQSVSYSVSYAMCLLYDPTRSVQSGSTIPLKLQLCNASNSDVSNSSVVVHAVSLVQTSTNSSQTLQASGNANPDNDFRFDSTLGPTGGYIFNLSTQGLTTGSYLLSFSAGADPVTHTLTFQVR